MERRQLKEMERRQLEEMERRQLKKMECRQLKEMERRKLKMMGWKQLKMMEYTHNWSMSVTEYNWRTVCTIDMLIGACTCTIYHIGCDAKKFGYVGIVFDL